MTSEQVNRYVSTLFDSKCAFVFSHNRDRSKHNPQLTTVSAILEKYYQLTRVSGMVDVYNNDILSPRTSSERFSGLFSKGKNMIRNLIYDHSLNKKEAVTNYRYLRGSLN
jgi:hypothetical protein